MTLSLKNVLSICSGCGGLDKGLERSGGTVIEAHDFDALACEGYERVMAQPIQQTDLTRKDPHSLPDADGMIGGPPCQAFSEANKNASPDNVKNLWPVTIEIVRAKCPSWFLFENVPGLLFRHTRYFNWVIDQFKDSGYRVEYRVLNAADYGVPQTRERVFIAGRLDGQAWKWPTPTHTETGDMFSPRRVSWKESLPDAWSAVAERGALPEWVTRRPTYQTIPDNALFNCKDMFKDRLHRDAGEPAFTLTTECIKRTRIVLDGTVYRADALAMTRMQSLPDVPLASHVIGNAVPPLLAQAIFSAAI
jgi:DNA (cytosine-5)-methyltransferase 1